MRPSRSATRAPRPPKPDAQRSLGALIRPLRVSAATETPGCVVGNCMCNTEKFSACFSGIILPENLFVRECQHIIHKGPERGQLGANCRRRAVRKRIFVHNWRLDCGKPRRHFDGACRGVNSHYSLRCNRIATTILKGRAIKNGTRLYGAHAAGRDLRNMSR